MSATGYRVDRLRSTMKENQEDAFLVTDSHNRRYLSGFSGSAGWLLITQQSQYIITDGRYWDQAQRESPGFELMKFERTVHKSLARATACLLEQLELGQGSRFSLELDNLSLLVFRKIQSALSELALEVTESEGRVRDLRLVKDAEELNHLREAARIADSALGAALRDFKVGQSERQLKADIEHQILLQGGHGASFPTIVASGVNGSFPHAGASDKVIEEGELVTIDFGAVYNGYCSDMTRTIWFGEISSRLQEILGAVREAQARAAAAVKPGITTGALDAVARDYLEQCELGQWFVHSLGHGIGLEVHEPPTLGKGTKIVLVEGQLVTVEPGVYIPGETGCRVEDTVVLTADGALALNQFPKQVLGTTGPLAACP